MTERKRHYFDSRWVLIGAMAFIAIAVNWIYPMVDLHGSLPSGSFVDSEVKGVEEAVHYAGGWPFRFFHQITYESAPAITYFDPRRLTGNLLIWTSLMVLSFLYGYHKRRKPIHAQKNDQDPLEIDLHTASASNNTGSDARIVEEKSTLPPASKNRPRVSFNLADMMLATAIIASLLGLWRWNQYKFEREKQLADKIQVAGGSVVMWASVPWPLSFLTIPQLDSLKRIRMVTWENPRQDLLDDIVKLPHLRVLRIGGSKYTIGSLAPLRRLPTFCDLRVSGRTVDPEFVALVGDLKALQALNLMRTNITASGLQSFEQLQRLQYLNIIHTDVKLAEIKNESWSNSIRVLHLPRPARGESDSLTINDWPKLRRLHCFEYDEKMNSSPVKITLHNMPNLEELAVDAIQCFELELKNLPKLSKLYRVEHTLSERVRVNEMVPDGIWTARLDLDNLPSLESLDVHLLNLESFSVTHCPKLSIKTNTQGNLPQIGTANRPEDMPFRGYSIGRKLNKKTTNRLLKMIGESKGLSTIDLSNIDLSTTALDPIAGCTNANKLLLNGTAIGIDQLAKLQTLKGIEALEVKGTSIRGMDLKKIMLWFPKLKSFMTSPEAIGRVRLENQSDIESINSGDLMGSDAVRLVNLLKLSDSIRLDPQLTYLWLENLPSVTGIELTGPWPDKGKITGPLRLSHFAAGGDHFSDAEFAPILEAAPDNLRYLTLAHSKVTEKSLEALNRFPSLTTLVLSGTNVSDSTILGWKSITKLDTLYINQTQATPKSLPWILSQTSIRKLSIDASFLDTAPPGALTSLTALRSLIVCGRDITPAVIDQITALKQLQELRFIDSDLSKDVFQRLGQQALPDLRYFDFRLCDVDQRAFSQYVRLLPRTTSIVCDDSDLDPELFLNLFQSNRIAFDSEPIRIALPGQQYLLRKSDAAPIVKQPITYGGTHPQLFQKDTMGRKQ